MPAPSRRLAGARAAGRRAVSRGWAKVVAGRVRAAAPLEPPAEAEALEAAAMALDPALAALRLLEQQGKPGGRDVTGAAGRGQEAAEGFLYGAVMQNSQLSALEQASVGTSIARMQQARHAGDGWFAPDTKPSFWRSVRGHLGLLGPDRHGASQ